MASFNKVILMGNLTRDPELRYTPKGTAIAKVGLAVNRVWTNEAGEKKEEVTFVDVDIFGRTAENVGQYMRKGRPILVEGRLKLDQWDDKQTGQKKYMTNIIGSDIVLLGGRGDGGGGEHASSSRGVAASSGGNNFDQSAPEPEHAQVGSSPITDEDIPF